MSINTNTHDEIMRELLSDPESREYWERTKFARAIAKQIIRYRAQHGLSQTALARRIGVSQPVVARWELGEHEPSVSTLRKLSRTLGMRFTIDIYPANVSPAGFPELDESAQRITSDGVEILLLAS